MVVSLDCADGSTMNRPFEVPTACGCGKCAGEASSSGASTQHKRSIQQSPAFGFGGGMGMGAGGGIGQLKGIY